MADPATDTDGPKAAWAGGRSRFEPIPPEEREGRGSIVFLVGVILALWAVPVVSTVWLSGLEREVEEVLEPARRAAEDLARVHARQMLYFQEWLLTGDFLAESRYRDLLRDEGDIAADLKARLEQPDVALSALNLPVVNAAIRWQLHHVDAFTDRGRPAFVEGPALEADQLLFEQLLDADAALVDELTRRAQAARRRAATAREWTLLISFGLVALALVGAATVAALARRLRVLVRDVRRRHRDTLRVRRELDAIFDATADAVVEVDDAGNVVRVNPAATRLLEWGEEDARGEPVERVLLGAGGRVGDASPVVEAARGGRVVDAAEGEVRARRGEEVPVLWSTRPLLDGPVTRGVVVTLTDLTEIREATEALRRAVTAREETLAVVSHDLRSPLSTVQAVGELLLDVPLDEEKRAEQLTNLLRASDRMERLIRDLLDIARIDARRLSVAQSPVAAEALLASAVNAMEARAVAAGIRLEHASSVAGMEVMADADRVQQVWENLVSNALRHTPRGGTVELGAEVAGDRVEFRVEDTGSGIAPEALPHLFDRFWRADQPRRDGAGLGLTIVRGIVEAHGGDVGVDSEVGAGTTFRFTLPLVRPSTSEEQRPRSS
jgi:PAS domain S-box-containing protein